MYLHKESIQVANILQVTAEVIQADEEVLTKVEATNTPVQAIITEDTNIKFDGRNTATNRPLMIQAFFYLIPQIQKIPQIPVQTKKDE